MSLFDRQVRLSIGEDGGSGFEIGAAAANGIPLHIKFSVEKADVESPNTGKVTVWNLNRAHLAALEKQDCVVIIRAGYGGNLTQAFAGTVTHAATSKEGADQMTEIELADSMVELRDTNLSVSYADGTTTDLIVQDVARRMGLPVSCSAGALMMPTMLSKGFSFVGSSKNLLKRLARIDGNRWTIQDGVLQVTKPGEPVSLTCYELNAECGLIGLPKRVNLSAGGGSSSGGAAKTTGEASVKSETAQLGWEITYLMNLAIGVNSYVHVTSRMVTGYFRVQKVSIEGDNYEGDWQCTATLLEITAS